MARTDVPGRLRAALALFAERPRAIAAWLTWPGFSLTSYRMLDDVRRLGIHPRTVIDVGANIGQFACIAARFFPDASVHSFEPVPEALRRLRANTARLPNVYVHEMALGSEPGEADMHVHAHPHASSLLPISALHRHVFPEDAEVAAVRVRVSTLDQELGHRTLEPPVLLKLDVQGYERWVLRGATATLPRIDYVIAEMSLQPLYEGEPTDRELRSDLASYCFRFVRQVGALAGPGNGEVLQVDGLFQRDATG